MELAFHEHGSRVRLKVKWLGGGIGSLLFLALLLSACRSNLPVNPASEPVHHLVILHTNDTHGHPIGFPYGQAPNAGGIPARATLIREIRRGNPNVLLLDAGDLNTGRAESNLFKALPDIEGFNAVGYDAVAVGNHEFDNPVEVFGHQIRTARFPFLSANIRKKDGSPFAVEYVMKDFPGFRVAIFGLTLRETPILANPQNVRELDFLDEVKTAEALVPSLRKQADLVIGLTHLGIFESPLGGSRGLAAQVGGIDVVVDGHSHTRMDGPMLVRNPSGYDTLLVQAWKWGLLLGRLDLWFQGGRIRDYRYEAIPINLKEARENKGVSDPSAAAPTPEDPALLSLLRPYADKAEALLSEVIGFAERSFSARKTWSEETPVGNLVADSIQWFASRWGADFSILNGGTIRGDLPEGPVSLKSIYDMIPFENSLYLVTLDGSEVERLFEFIATIPGGRGSFPQFSSEVRCVLDRSSMRPEKVLIRGKPIERGRMYRVATHSYLAAGGDGYNVFLEAREKYDTAALQQPVLIEYIRSLGVRLVPKLDGRIVLKTGGQRAEDRDQQ
jgi:5'-nucleotidase / UDP-sugar diphosphatase